MLDEETHVKTVIMMMMMVTILDSWCSRETLGGVSVPCSALQWHAVCW